MVSDSLSSDKSAIEGSERENRSASPFPYTDIFNEKFPYYLSIGMTYEQFWEQDCELVVPYRKAEKIREERQNQEFWLQGMYIYDAVARLSPILRSFAKKGTKPEPYPEEPYPLSKKSMENLKEKKEKANQEKAKRFMEAFMVKNNQRFEERK